MSYHVSEQLKERCLSFLDEALVNVEKCTQAFSIKVCFQFLFGLKPPF